LSIGELQVSSGGFTPRFDHRADYRVQLGSLEVATPGVDSYEVAIHT
jgi:hypothetical protein